MKSIVIVPWLQIQRGRIPYAYKKIITQINACVHLGISEFTIEGKLCECYL